MASKEAVLQAFMLISSNTKLCDKDDTKTVKLVLRSWQMALDDISDTLLAVGVMRFLREVKEVYPSTVVSAKLRELCQPPAVPFNEYEILDVVAALRSAGRDNVDKLLEIRDKTNPLLWKVIDNFGVDFIFNLTYEQLATVNAQLRDAYRQAYRQKQANLEADLFNKMSVEARPLLEAKQ